MTASDITQIGTVGVLFVFAIKEFFSYLKTRKNGGSTDNAHLISIFTELKTMNNNHLHSIQEAIEQGNARLVDTIHNDNARMIEILGEIKGNLSARK